MTLENNNRDVFRSVPPEYLSCELEPAEFILLRRFAGRWHEIDMLDLGVGAGRTTHTFGALARSYVGVDYAEQMIAEARRRVPPRDRLDFVFADARDLSAFHDASFDVVLFSCNGIDAVDYDDRLCILMEIRRVLRPGGSLFFSVHNLNAYPPKLPAIAIDLRRPVRSLVRAIRHARFSRQLRRAVRRTDLAVVRARGWGMLLDGAHDFKVQNFYIDPFRQLAELRMVGFDVEGSWARSGEALDATEPTTSGWVWFLAHPSIMKRLDSQDQSDG